MKMCCSCKEEKTLSEFFKDKKTPDGHTYACKACKAIKNRKRYETYTDETKAKRLKRHQDWKAKNPERYKDLIKSSRLKVYDLTLPEYQKLLADQNNVCAICSQPETAKSKVLSVDHCHTTGKVRGLLCNRCNVGIGYFKDKASLLQSAIKYLASKYERYVTTRSDQPKG